MKKINIVVASEDNIYLKQLTNYLVKSTRNFEVYSFSKQDSLIRFLCSPEQKADILLLCEDMQSKETDNCDAVCKILLTEEGNQNTEGYHCVQKYQKMGSIVNEVVLFYGRDSGKASQIAHGAQTTRFIGVYSPVGGSGKSMLALLLAQHLGRKGMKVFYQNYERIDSSREIIPAHAQIGLSDLLVAVHSRESGVGLSLLSKMCTDQKLGFSYVNPPDSSLEFNEVSLEEQLMLLDEVKQLAQFDAVVLDFDSELNHDKLTLLERCDFIVVPFLPDVLSINKMNQFWRELDMHEELSDLKEKLVYVANRIAPGMDDYLRQRGVLTKCTPAAMLPLSARLADVNAAIQSGSGVENELGLLAEHLM